MRLWLRCWRKKALPPGSPASLPPANASRSSEVRVSSMALPSPRLDERALSRLAVGQSLFGPASCRTDHGGRLVFAGTPSRKRLSRRLFSEGDGARRGRPAARQIDAFGS